MITIHENTFREETLDGCDKEDVEAYDQKIGEFLQYLAKKAEPHGIEITCSKNELGISYSADTDLEHWFWAHFQDFWDWYESYSFCDLDWSKR